MSIIKEFREFISRGNVVDLAVGVIIGAAFNGIVKSLVDQVIMPPIGLLTGGLDFSKLEWVLKPEDPVTEAVEKVAIQYGAFINTLIQFLIVAAVVFLLVKLVNSIRRADAAEPGPTEPPAPTPGEALLMEIRDLLAKDAAGPKA
jgi:large conductance mechanosensitive channel